MEIQEMVAVAVNMLHERERISENNAGPLSEYSAGEMKGLLKSATMLLEVLADM